MKLVVPFALAVSFAASAAFAVDHVVAPGQSIQAAIDAAANGDRVLVEPGTYFVSLDMKGKAIELVGAQGAKATILDGTGQATAESSLPVIRCWSGEGPGTVIRGLTIQNGSGWFYMSGGGISGRFAYDGPMAAPTVEDCIIRWNEGYSFGGGIFSNGVVRRCVVFENECEFTGGGIATYEAENAVIEDSVIASNSASPGEGGGIAIFGGKATIRNCIVCDNLAWDSATGGGVLVSFGATATIEGCLVSRNIAYEGLAGVGQGGGVYVANPATATINRCTIVDNIAGESTGNNVGGVYGPAIITNSILRGNADVQVSPFFPPKEVSYCAVESGAAGTGNLDADPLFVDAAGGDYHLRPGSPCIDAGDPLALDPDGTRVDVGAHWFRTLYALDNVLPEHWSDPSWSEVSAVLGGKQRMRILSDPSKHGQLYWALGSISGTAPGLTGPGGATVPLNADGYLAFSLLNPNQGPLPVSLGTIDAQGFGRVEFRLPPGGPAAFAGTVHHAALVLAPGLGWIQSVTNPEPVKLVP